METIELIREKVIPGDAVRIAERAGKSREIVYKIINGTRSVRPWFIEHATAYLRDQGRIKNSVV